MINKISAAQPDSKEPKYKAHTVKPKTVPVVGEQSAALFRALVAEKMKEGKNSEKN